MTPRYLDPKVDLAFKRVFGEHAHLLKSFLNALLPLPEDALIDSLVYLTPEQVPEIPGLLKNSIVDVKCTDTQGRIFIVEMQMMWRPSFEHRIVFGASQAYVKQLKVGEGYTSLQPVYALALINDVFDHKTDSYYHHYQIVNTLNPEEVLKGLEFVFIELPKFKPETPTARRMQVLWLRFLSEVGQDSRVLDAQMQADTHIADALHLVETAAFTEAELDTYHVGLDRSRIEIDLLDYAKKEGRVEGLKAGKAEGLELGKAEGLELGKAEGLEQGKAEGLEQGKAEGLEQGKAEGLEQGKAEGAHQQALQIASKLWAAGMDATVIASMTGLAVQDVLSIAPR